MHADRNYRGLLIALSLFFAVASLRGQAGDKPIARFGNHTIGVKEFLAAYGKNNPDPVRTTKAYEDYLELYLRYRLKVQSALDARLDTLPAQQNELQNFRNQIADQFSVDSPTLRRLTREVYDRSQRDIRVSVIFITVPKEGTPADTLKAFKRVQAAEKALKSNGSFAETAVGYSDDPFAKTNQGDLGFITVFELPYPLESAAFRLATGQVSRIVRTTGGYALLKKTAERPAAGRVRVAQILLTWPYEASEAAKTETRHRADSLKKVLDNGADFADIARRFSGDNLTYQIGGVMPEFGVGRYDSLFEARAFALTKDGQTSEPFASAFGVHLLKRLARIAPPQQEDKKTMDELRNRVMADPRISIAREQLLKIMERQTGLKESGPSRTDLFACTDSVVRYNHLPAKPAIDTTAVLFRMADQQYSVSDWLTYRKSLAPLPGYTSAHTDASMFTLYWQRLLGEYYKNHLEKYNPVFARQLMEFRDGNLLFDVMQRQVWEKASADTAGLRAYFDAHARNYRWTPSADALQFTVGNPETARVLRAALGKDPADWRKMTDSLGAGVQADSGRMELRQIPGAGEKTDPGFTTPVINADHSEQFAYLLRFYPGSAARTFSEARGLVINDYQGELENRWIAELKKKYPVTVNGPEVKALPK